MFPVNFFKNRQRQIPQTNGMQSLGAFLQRLMPGLGKRPSIAGTLEHLGTMPLTAHSSLALVRLHGETLLLGITPQSVNLLAKGSPETVSPVAALDGRGGQEPLAL